MNIVVPWKTGFAQFASCRCNTKPLSYCVVANAAQIRNSYCSIFASTTQIFLEVHGKSNLHAELLRKIAVLDYALFSYEVNGNALSACEYSFIHLDCMERYAATMLKRYLNNVMSQ
ncbi:unnamed protein product [Heligmosomoides polygyrus]|uniref:Transcriptional regulator n=1 Tax=Heligmosomoides polygyrus TaxID=6339 RepID=A0A183FUT3_HELPZ|nr:unnamed protein product [Heligmosomoides polygyrus]